MRYTKINIAFLSFFMLLSYSVSGVADTNRKEEINEFLRGKSTKEMNDYYKQYHPRVPRQIKNFEGMKIEVPNNSPMASPRAIPDVKKLPAPPADAVFPGEYEEIQAIVVTWPYVALDSNNNFVSRVFEGVGELYDESTGNSSFVMIKDYYMDLNSQSQMAHIFLNLINDIQEDAEAWIVIDKLGDSVELKKFASDMGMPMKNVRFIEAPANSFWYRDCGPMAFYYDNMNKIGLLDFEYYPGRPLDDALNDAVSRFSDYPLLKSSIEYEGGNILVDGYGKLFTSTALYPNNKDKYGQYYYDASSGQIGMYEKTPLSEKQCQDSLIYQMKLNQIHVLPALKYDGGTGHIDLYADMTSENEFVFGKFPEEMKALTDYKTIINNVDSLLTLTNYNGTKYTAKYIPTPRDNNGKYYKSNSAYNRATRTFSNHLVLNKSIIQPVFSNKVDGDKVGDSLAILAIKKAYPGYKIKPVDMRAFDGFGGSIHCITKQIPATDPIRISHKPITKENYSLENNTAKLQVKIQSNKEVKKAKAYFKMTLDAKWTEVELVKGTDGVYVADLLCPVGCTPQTIFFYISASTDSKTMTAPMTAPDGYYTAELQGSSVCETSTKLNVYPNPSSDVLFVNLSSFDNPNMNISIIDNMGKEVYNRSITNADNLPTLSINTNLLSTGNYILVITSANNIQREKFSVVR